MPEHKISNWWRGGAAVAATVIISLQVSIMTQQPQPQDMQLLGNKASYQQQDAWLFQIAIHDDVQWLDITKLLAKLNAQLIEGPSSVGIIRIAVPKKQQEWTGAEQVKNWLKAQAVIDHAAIEQE